jgi:hypothetical protein
MKSINVLIITVTVMGLSVNLAGAQNLLLNGDFNSPSTTNSSPTSWTVSTSGASDGSFASYEIVPPGNLIDENDGTVHPDNTGNYDGTYQMSLGGTSGNGEYGEVSQIVSATEGLNYDLNVDAGAQGWWLPTGYINLIFLDSGSSVLADNQITTTGSIHNGTNGGQGDMYDIGVPYQNWNLTAIAPAGTTQVEVMFQGIGGGTSWFDNAVLTAVPEPSALAMLVAGGVMLLGYRRSLRRA